MKHDLNDLAIFGGQPAFAEPRHVGRPNIGEKADLMRRLEEVIDRRWLTNAGPMVREFEARLCGYLGVKHCVAVCNATVGLEIAIRALGLSGEVIIPSFTFVATAHALQWQEITPVFCDVDPGSHLIDPAKVEALVTPRTTGVIGVHLWGRACDAEALGAICRRHGLKLMFDAAHALGCTARGRMIGGLGEAEVLSFHATKFLNTFEGGAVVTDDDALAEKLRLMRNFGFSGYDNVIYIGTNGKMPEPCAAMGLTGLDSIDRFIAVNRRNHELYGEILDAIPGVRFHRYDLAERSNYQYVVAEIDGDTLGISRDAMVAALQGENVLARRYFHPGCHRMQPYRDLFPDAGDRLPVTEKLCASILALPTGTGVSEGDVREIAGLVRFIAARGREISGRMRGDG